MKKVLRRIFLCVIAVLMVVTAVACNKVDFKNTTFTAWGKVKENYGFIAETDEYYYFINGVEDYSVDNTFGKPIKGSLMVADRDNLNRAEVAVPKLFVATDYNSGLFISGDYVYYGTPNTEKNGSGAIANTEMVFTKTKLDGTDSTKILTVNSLSTEYRFVENNGVVYLVYALNDSIECLNVNTGVSETVIKKDVKSAESLDAYKFAFSNDLEKFTVIYTVTVYSGTFVSEGTRITETYNKLYYFKAGEGSTCLLDGSKETENTIYHIDAIADGFVFFCKNVEGAEEETQGALQIYNMTPFDVDNSANIGENNLYYSPESVFVFDSESKKIIQTSLIGKENDYRRVVAAGVSVNKLLFLDGGNIYYVNGDGFIARIELYNEEAKEVVVSSEAASTTWYAPKILNGKIFYCADGYVRYVDVTAEPTFNEEKEIYELSASKLLGVKTVADKASEFSGAVAKISITVEDGEPVSKTLDDAKRIYAELSKEARELVASSYSNLVKFENALEVSKKFATLGNVTKYYLMDDAEKEALKTAYLQVKEYIKGVNDIDAVREAVPNNLNCNYYDCQKLFEEASK